MAVDKRAAKRKLEGMLMTMSMHRRARAAYRDKGNASGVERCERLLKYDYLLIREHCAEYDLEIPRDVPPAGKE